MKIEVKAVKHSEFASQETNCFECKVYIDGQAVAMARNEGMGGETQILPLATGCVATIKRAEDYCMSSLPWFKHDPATGNFVDVPANTEGALAQDLSMVVDFAVEDHLRRKALTKQLRKITLLMPDKTIEHYPAKFKPSPEAFAIVKQKNPGCVVLNELPFDEALKIFYDSVAQQ